VLVMGVVVVVAVPPVPVMRVVAVMLPVVTLLVPWVS
jgi:hypothetical protein